jgi:hypothetical protein
MEIGVEINKTSLKVGPFLFGVVPKNEFWPSEKVLGYDALIIDGSDADFARKKVFTIRSHHNNDVYLKPLFLLKASSKSDAIVNELVDGVIFSLEQVELLSNRVQEIFLKNNEILQIKSLSFEAEIINKVINLLVSREKKQLISLPYPSSGIGYFFPEISVNFANYDEHNVMRILKIAEDDGLFTSTYNERIYLCTNCQNGLLSYREVCPQCSSSHSVTEDLVHHFPCAYVGPIKDFQNTIDDDLNCPKCNKKLRHIGVDYDKPSVLHTCQGCSHQYQDYHVKAKCLTCHFDNPVETLISREIRDYKLTRKGISVAYNGYLSTTKDFDEVPGTVKYDVFKIMLKYEIERLRQSDYTSNIAYVHLLNAGEIYSRIGIDRQKALIAEMIGILRHNLRSSDFISFYDASTLVLSMNEIPNKIANKILQEIADLTVGLMKRNFKTIDIQMSTLAVPLDTQMSHELQLQNLLKKIDRTPENHKSEQP